MIANKDSERMRQCTPTVLVVDDVRSMRWILTSIVKSCGYRCIAVEDGPAAWQLVNEQYPDMIITDIEMQLGDGLELIHKIRNAGDAIVRKTPIIVCSSLAESLRDRPLLCSADDFLSKPVDLRHLKSALQSYLEY